MKGELIAEQSIVVGEPVVVEGRSPLSRDTVVFEDDGETGYLYAVDISRKQNPILDAMQIYNVAQFRVSDGPVVVQLLWSSDGLKAALSINKYVHAVFDFAARRGYCRTGFPPAGPTWTEHDHSWDDSALQLFR